MNNEIDSIIEDIKKIPGITNKQAKKVVYFLLNQTEQFRIDYFENLNKKINKIKKCEICSIYTLNKLCEICSSNNKNKQLVVVENVDQILKFEEWKMFNSKYFVIPILFNSKFEKNNYDFDVFLKYIKQFDEVLITISPTAQGLLTIDLIIQKIKEKEIDIKISQLATGIPIGSSIDYIDKLTMKYAIKNRKDVE